MQRTAMPERRKRCGEKGKRGVVPTIPCLTRFAMTDGCCQLGVSDMSLFESVSAMSLFSIIDAGSREAENDR